MINERRRAHVRLFLAAERASAAAAVADAEVARAAHGRLAAAAADGGAGGDVASEYELRELACALAGAPLARTRMCALPRRHFLSNGAEELDMYIYQSMLSAKSLCHVPGFF